MVIKNHNKCCIKSNNNNNEIKNICQNLDSEEYLR